MDTMEALLARLGKNAFTELGLDTLVHMHGVESDEVFTEKVMHSYNSSSFTQRPHIYKTIDQSYRSMLSSRKSQAVIMLGVSGSGKSLLATEAIRYLNVTHGDGGSNAAQGDTVRILEAFGNACTNFHQNSSRHCKLLSLNFTPSGTVKGARVRLFMLEHARVVLQRATESNFHCFYEMLSLIHGGTDLELGKRWGIRVPDAKAENFRYLGGRANLVTHPGQTLAALAGCGFSQQEQDSIFQTLSAILHAGNIEFAAQIKLTNEVASVSDMKSLQQAATLLGVNPGKFQTALTCHNIGKHSVCLITHTVPQAMVGIDSVTRTLYRKLVHWICSRLNALLLEVRALQGKSVEPSEESSLWKAVKDPGSGMVYYFNPKTNATVWTKPEGAGNTKPAAVPSDLAIQLLDVSGVESLQKVGRQATFDQFCANYASEKLQQLYIQKIFAQEHQECKSEGLRIPLHQFIDNSDCMVMIETPHTGLLALLDEQVVTLAHGGDAQLLKKIFANHGKSNVLRRPADTPSSSTTGIHSELRSFFVVVHSWGEVAYDVRGMVDSNRDNLHDDMLTLLRGSTCEFIRSLVELELEEHDSSTMNASYSRKGRSAALRRRPTMVMQCCEEINSVVAELQPLHSRFVCCLKPSTQNSLALEQQIGAMNLFPLCLAQIQGYAYRRSYREFVSRYSVLADITKTSMDTEKDGKALAQQLEKNGQLRRAEYHPGKTKMFMTLKQYAALEDACALLDCDEITLRKTILVQSYIRMFIRKAKYSSILHTRRKLQEAALKQDSAKLRYWINVCEKRLPYAGSRLEDVAAARRVEAALLTAAEQDTRAKFVVKQLRDNMSSVQTDGDLSDLFRLVSQADALHCQDPLVEQARKLFFPDVDGLVLDYFEGDSSGEEMELQMRKKTGNQVTAGRLSTASKIDAVRSSPANARRKAGRDTPAGRICATCTAKASAADVDDLAAMGIKVQTSPADLADLAAMGITVQAPPIEHACVGGGSQMMRRKVGASFSSGKISTSSVPTSNSSTIEPIEEADKKESRVERAEAYRAAAIEMNDALSHQDLSHLVSVRSKYEVMNLTDRPEYGQSTAMKSMLMESLHLRELEPVEGIRSRPTTPPMTITPELAEIVLSSTKDKNVPAHVVLEAWEAIQSHSFLSAKSADVETIQRRAQAIQRVKGGLLGSKVLPADLDTASAACSEAGSWLAEAAVWRKALDNRILDLKHLIAASATTEPVTAEVVGTASGSLNALNWLHASGRPWATRVRQRVGVVLCLRRAVCSAYAVTASAIRSAQQVITGLYGVERWLVEGAEWTVVVRERSRILDILDLATADCGVPADAVVQAAQAADELLSDKHAWLVVDNSRYELIKARYSAVELLRSAVATRRIGVEAAQIDSAIATVPEDVEDWLVQGPLWCKELWYRARVLALLRAAVAPADVQMSQIQAAEALRSSAAAWLFEAEDWTEIIQSRARVVKGVVAGTNPGVEVAWLAKAQLSTVVQLPLQKNVTSKMIIDCQTALADIEKTVRENVDTALLTRLLGTIKGLAACPEFVPDIVLSDVDAAIETMEKLASHDSKEKREGACLKLRQMLMQSVVAQPQASSEGNEMGVFIQKKTPVEDSENYTVIFREISLGLAFKKDPHSELAVVRSVYGAAMQTETGIAPGHVLAAVQGSSMLCKTFRESMHILRAARRPLKIEFRRNSSALSHDEADVVTVTLGLSEGPLGLQMRNNLCGVDLSAVVEAVMGQAAKAGLQPGMWLLSVNGLDTTNVEFSAAERIVRMASRPVELRFLPHPPATLFWGGPLQPLHAGDTFTVEFGDGHLGLQLVECPSGPDLSAVVAAVAPNSLAARATPKIRPGDYVHCVNSIYTIGMSCKQTLDVIVAAQRPVTFVFERHHSERHHLQFRWTSA